MGWRIGLTTDVNRLPEASGLAKFMQLKRNPEFEI